jgi:hypothetical protein
VGRRAALRSLFDYCGCVSAGTGPGTQWPRDRAGGLALCAAAAVEVALRDGTLRAASVEGPPDHGSRPASDGDLLAKWRRLTGYDGSPFFERLVAADDDEPLVIVLEGPLGALLR